MSFHRSILLAVVLCLAGWPVFAQVVRLPDVEPREQSYPGRLVSHPDSSGELLEAPGEVEQAPEPGLPRDARPGMFQKLIFDGTWLAPGGSRGLGIGDVQLRCVLALPLPSRESPLIITPGFAVHYLDGPAGVDLPPRLYDAYTQFRWMSQLSPRLGVDLAVTPGVYSDFEQNSDDALRITGHGIGAWTINPNLKMVLGASYLDRPDIDVLPIGGLIWTPREDVRFELIFPHPRIARRVYLCGAYGDQLQDWAYLAAEFGGDAWAIARTGGGNDIVILRDYRIIFGVERKVIGGLDGRLEIGYVFGRKIEYAGTTPDFEPTNTVMLRGGLTY